ncbi:LppU/SCO3897 family protein [Pilimelia anulata]|nr:hypothetical protein [Pilimelia anulata]
MASESPQDPTTGRARVDQTGNVTEDARPADAPPHPAGRATAPAVTRTSSFEPIGPPPAALSDGDAPGVLPPPSDYLTSPTTNFPRTPAAYPAAARPDGPRASRPAESRTARYGAGRPVAEPAGTFSGFTPVNAETGVPGVPVQRHPDNGWFSAEQPTIAPTGSTSDDVDPDGRTEQLGGPDSPLRRRTPPAPRVTGAPDVTGHAADGRAAGPADFPGTPGPDGRAGGIDGRPAGSEGRLTSAESAPRVSESAPQAPEGAAAAAPRSTEPAPRPAGDAAPGGLRRDPPRGQVYGRAAGAPNPWAPPADPGTSGGWPTGPRSWPETAPAADEPPTERFTGAATTGGWAPTADRYPREQAPGHAREQAPDAPGRPSPGAFGAPPAPGTPGAPAGALGRTDSALDRIAAVTGGTPVVDHDPAGRRAEPDSFGAPPAGDRGAGPAGGPGAFPADQPTRTDVFDPSATDRPTRREADRPAHPAARAATGAHPDAPDTSGTFPAGRTAFPGARTPDGVPAAGGFPPAGRSAGYSADGRPGAYPDPRGGYPESPPRTIDPATSAFGGADRPTGAYPAQERRAFPTANRDEDGFGAAGAFPAADRTPADRTPADRTPADRTPVGRPPGDRAPGAATPAGGPASTGPVSGAGPASAGGPGPGARTAAGPTDFGQPTGAFPAGAFPTRDNPVNGAIPPGTTATGPTGRGVLGTPAPTTGTAPRVPGTRPAGGPAASGPLPAGPATAGPAASATGGPATAGPAPTGPGTTGAFPVGAAAFPAGNGRAGALPPGARADQLPPTAAHPTTRAGADRTGAPTGPTAVAAEPAAPTTTGAVKTADGDDAPAPQVRNGRVLLAVLGAAVLLLVVPFVAIWALTPPDEYAVGKCVKQVGENAQPTGCGEAGSFQIVQRTNDQAQCPDKNQPAAVMQGRRPTLVLCLKPAV